MVTNNPYFYRVIEYIILFPGAYDLWQIIDLIDQKLQDYKVKIQNYIPAFSFELQNFLENFKKSNLLMIDVCNTCCRKNSTYKFFHFKISDLIFEKNVKNI